MRFGKVYRLFSTGSRVDKEHLVVSEDSAAKIVVEPRRDSGWRMGDIGDRLLVMQYLDAYPKSSYAVRIFTWPDSFEQFGDLKRLLVERDYQYDLDTHGDGNSITLVSGSYTPRVQ